MVLGNNIGFEKITSQIQNLTVDLSQYKEEINRKIEVGRCNDNGQPITVFKLQGNDQLLNQSILVLPNRIDILDSVSHIPLVQEDQLDNTDTEGGKLDSHFTYFKRRSLMLTSKRLKGTNIHILLLNSF